MQRTPLSFEQAPNMTGETANEIREFLLELTSAFENCYYGQLKQYEEDQEELFWELQHQQQMRHQTGTQDEASVDLPF